MTTTLTEIQKKMVETFRFDYAHPELNKRIEDFAPNETVSSRFLVKMEIARMARPCSRIIDLRDIQKDWQPFDLNGIRHFMNEGTSAHFTGLIKKYRGYTIGAYELLMQYAQRRQLQEKINPNSIDAPPAEFTSVTHFYQRKEQRLYYVSPIEVFTNYSEDLTGIELRKTAMRGHTTDISQHGMCIKFSGLQLPADTTEIFIRFVGFERDFKISQPVFVQYDVLSVSSKQTNYYYRIRLAKEQSSALFEEFNDGLKKFIFAQLRRYRVPIENTQEAIKVKGYEQYLINKMTSLPVLLTEKDHHWIPDATFITSTNESVLQKLTDVDHVSMLTDLVTQDHIQAQIRHKTSFTEYFLLSPVSTPETYVNFVYIPLGDVYRNDMARRVAKLAYLRSQGNLLLFRVDGATIQPEHECHVPSSLPDSTSANVHFVNNKMKERSVTLASGYHKLLSFTEQSDLIPKLFEFVDDNQDSVDTKEIFEFIPKKKSFISELHVVKNEVEDRRKEDRFLCKLTIIARSVKHPKKDFFGHTLDISAHGLKIQLDEPMRLFQGDVVSIDFLNLKTLNGEDIVYQGYQVVADRGNILQLHVSGSLAHHEGKKAIQRLINDNLNSLTASGNRDSIYGLSRVIRNLYAYNHPFAEIYIKRNNNIRYISDVALSNNTLLPEFSINEEENKEIIRQILKQETYTQLLNNSWNQIKDSQDFIFFDILVTIKEKNNNEGYFVMVRDAGALFDTRKIFDAYTQASVLGETKLIRTLMSVKANTFDKYFKEELGYLSRYAPNRAKMVSDEIASIQAVGVIIDMTASLISS